MLSTVFEILFYALVLGFVIFIVYYGNDWIIKWVIFPKKCKHNMILATISLGSSLGLMVTMLIFANKLSDNVTILSRLMFGVLALSIAVFLILAGEFLRKSITPKGGMQDVGASGKPMA